MTPDLPPGCTPDDQERAWGEPVEQDDDPYQIDEPEEETQPMKPRITLTDTIPVGFMVEFYRWRSPRRPYRATVRLNGGCVGVTGACATAANAERAARKIIAVETRR